MKKEKIGVFIIFLLLLFTIFLWYLRMPLADRFLNFYAITTSLGQISGLVGMVLFIITIILSSRLQFFEDYFGGLNKVYFWHHFLGGISLILLLFHPIVLLIKFISVSLISAFLFLLPIGEMSITFGMIALLFMILLLYFTFFTNFRYRTWKVTHKFLGIAFFFAILHTFFVPSDVSLYLPMKIYMGFLVLLGILVFIYRTLFGKIFVPKFFYIVEKVNQLNEKVVEIIMFPQTEKLNFLPGQFIFLSFKGKGITREIHPFSISSGRFDNKLSVIVKNLGDYTAKLKNLRAGSMAIIEGPYGKFSYLNSCNNDQVWIAGGIGITPFLSMARSFRNNNFKIDLYYCSQTKDELVFFEELSNISNNKTNFRLVPFCADVKGHINIKTINNFSGDIKGKDFFLCGPPAMMRSLRSQLLVNGVARKNIHSEEFNF